MLTGFEFPHAWYYYSLLQSVQVELSLDGTETTAAIMTPQGYCFVEFVRHEDAIGAQLGLDGKLALNRKLVVQFCANTSEASKAGSTGMMDKYDSKPWLAGRACECERACQLYCVRVVLRWFAPNKHGKYEE